MENKDPHKIAGGHQIPLWLQRLLLQSGQRSTSTRNHTTEGFADIMSPHGSNGTTNGCTSHDSGDFSTTLQPARNQNGYIAPLRAYQQYTARTGRDDPFFSNELYHGMLNGQPDNKQVGRMYTNSQQQEIDAYYRRLMAPRPEQQPKISAPPTPPPRLRMEAMTSANGSDLAVGDMAYWNPEWSDFVNDDDAE